MSTNIFTYLFIFNIFRQPNSSMYTHIYMNVCNKFLTIKIPNSLKFTINSKNSLNSHCQRVRRPPAARLSSQPRVWRAVDFLAIEAIPRKKYVRPCRRSVRGWYRHMALVSFPTGRPSESVRTEKAMSHSLSFPVDRRGSREPSLAEKKRNRYVRIFEFPEAQFGELLNSF